MIAVKIPVHVRERGSPLSPAELSDFLAAIRGQCLEAYYLFLLYTGCRRNEALILRAADVDYKKGQLHIRGTKTAGSDRTLPLFDSVADLLAKITPQNDGLFFPFRPDYPTHHFKKICPAHKLHDLRHTFATRCLEAKIPMIVVKTWLGHSEIATTADIYSHVTAEIDRAAARTLDEYMTKSPHE